MFFNLPHEIIRLIYSFDCTYKLEFDKVLEDIERYKITKTQTFTIFMTRHYRLCILPTICYVPIGFALRFMSRKNKWKIRFVKSI